jgi:hypothetical protein
MTSVGTNPAGAAWFRSMLVVLSMLVAIAMHAPVARASAPGPDSPAAAPGTNLTYHNGPVQHAQKIFTIFWNPTFISFPIGYQTTINQFVQDLNRSSYYAIGSQYSDLTSHISKVLSYGGSWLDTTNAFPNTTLTFSDLLDEVSRSKAFNGWTSDANSFFLIYTPGGINSSIMDNCGAHLPGNPSPVVQILFPQDSYPCFVPSPWPNGRAVDSAINISAGQIMATLTDPFGTAWNVDGNQSDEIDFLCFFDFGARAPDGSNVTLGGHKYVVQQEWSNASSGCVLAYGNGRPTTAGDFDGDGKTDISVYRPSSGGWYDLLSSTNYTTYGTYLWGLTGDIPVQGDFDGDGKEDIAVYRPSNGGWYILLSSTSYTTYASYLWGAPGDIPEPGDYDGDGRTDIAAYRPSSGTWFILLSSSGYTTYTSQIWGLTGDMPVPGDYDGDGETDIAVYRPSNGGWYALQSSTNNATYLSFLWGLGGDVPVGADYDGDGKVDPAVYRPSNGGWYFLRSSTNYATYGAYLWGLAGDVPVPADYDGDGKADIAVYRPSAGLWYILQSSTNYAAYVSYSWGLAGDVQL